MRKLLAAVLTVAGIILSVPAQAQWNVTSGCVPVGRGPGKTGFLSGCVNSGTIKDLTITNSLAVPTTVLPTLFDAAYCNTIGYVIVRLTGTWTCSKALPADPVWWGADATGVADSASAFNSALAASSWVRFPKGKFRFNSTIAYTFSAGSGGLRIDGSGAENTILYWPASNGLSVTYNDHLQAASVSNLTLTSGGGGSYVGLTLTHTTCLLGGSLVPNSFRDLVFRGDTGSSYWAIGASIVGVSYTNWDAVSFIGLSTIAGNGVQFAGNPVTCGTTSGYAIWHNMTKPGFYNLNGGIVYGEYVQGVQVHQANFITSNTAIYAAPGLAGSLAQLTVSDSDIEVNVNAFNLNTVIPYVFVHHNVITVANNQIGIDLENSQYATNIQGNVVQCASATGTTGIKVGSGTNGVITGNTFVGCLKGVDLTAGSSNYAVNTNVYDTVTSTVVDAGTSNIIGDLSRTVPVKTADYTIATTDHSLIFNGAGSIALTLGSASAQTGRKLMLLNQAAQPVVSPSSNVVPLAGGAAGTAILAGTAGKWVTLEAVGANWQIMAGN